MAVLSRKVYLFGALLLLSCTSSIVRAEGDDGDDGVTVEVSYLEVK